MRIGIVPLIVVACMELLGGVAAARQQVIYANGAVAADHALASQAGVEMLKLGGNAVDAAVAASFTLSVVRPYSCGIGGGGFMLIAVPAAGSAPAYTIALDYRERCPAAVGPTYYGELDDALASRSGPHAIGVPGTVAGLLYALTHFGTLDRATVMQPAIRIAKAGWNADASHVAATRTLARRLEQSPHCREAARFIWHQLAHEGRLQVGDLLVNPIQAATLRMIARSGGDAFYRGPLAERIVTRVESLGGALRVDDLIAYTVRRLPPVEGVFRDYTVLSMPPPSSGGVAMIQMLAMIEGRIGELDPSGPDDADYIQIVTESMKHAFADRAAWLADPDYADVPVAKLLDRDDLARRAATIRLDRTFAPTEYGVEGPPPDDHGTSHLSVIDGDGMAVACSETMNLEFGSMVAVEGFVLNDQMDDFTTDPGKPNAFGLIQSARNEPQPGKRPLSSMTPTILLRDGKAVLVVGASGGPRIITGTLQCVLNVTTFDMHPREAIERPRFHHQWLPDRLLFEQRWSDPLVVRMLAARGHVIGSRQDIGVVQMVTRDDAGLRAASDPRKGGRAAGY